MTARIRDIYRYPVKGLSAERLDRVELAPDSGLPHDRRFALAHASAKIDPGKLEWRHKTDFLMLMKNARLAALRTRFNEGDGALTIERDGETVLRADITSADGRARMDDFFSGFMEAEAPGKIHLIDGRGHMFSDYRSRVVSMINLASIRDLEREVGQNLDPLRFRANCYFDGVDAWEDFNWIGDEVIIGGARLRITKRIERCGATNVNPSTAARDMNLPKALQKGFGHVDLGIYGTVIGGGALSTGDEIEFPDVG